MKMLWGRIEYTSSGELLVVLYLLGVSEKMSAYYCFGMKFTVSSENR